jgi:hypothetical protein
MSTSNSSGISNGMFITLCILVLGLLASTIYQTIDKGKVEQALTYAQGDIAQRDEAFRADSAERVKKQVFEEACMSNNGRILVRATREYGPVTLQCIDANTYFTIPVKFQRGFAR